MQPAALPRDEAQRLQTLLALELLDTPPERTFDALVECAAQLTDCPIALITLLDDRRQWFKARRGLDATETPREVAFCAHAILADALFEVPDALQDPRFGDNPLVTGAPHIRFYAGAPLRHHGMPLGTLCVIDTAPRTLDAQQRELLRHLATVAGELIESRARLLGLQQERARLADLSRASGDWMWELDAELRYRWISGDFESVTGLTAASMIGRALGDAEALDASGRPRADGQRLHALLRSGAPLRRVVCAEHTPRGLLHLSRSAVPVRDAQGALLGWRGTSRDVSAQLAAEMRAHRQEELLHKLSSQLPGAVFQYQRAPDGRGRYRYVSEGARQLFGEGADAALMRDPSHRIDPRDRRRLEAAVRRSARRLEPGVAVYRVQHPTLGERWVETRAAPERLPDGSTQWHGFSADVTDRQRTELALRHSETRWALAADAAGIGVAELDTQAGELRFDRVACANHGLPYPHPRFTLADWFACIDPADRDGAAAGVAAAIEHGGRFDGRLRLHRPDGSLRWLEIAVRVDAPRSRHVLATCRDVHAQVEAETLRRDKEAAERATRAKSQFLSRVSHELRTPLNGILGFAQMMALDDQHGLPPPQQQRLDGVRAAGRHLLALIDDLLELARIEHQPQQLALQAVDASAALAGCLNLLQPLAAAHRVVLPPAPTEPCWVRAQPRALEQVLTNLLGNAVKYNRPGGNVWVEVVRVDGRVRIGVRDDGPGLDAAQRARLFQPFDRLGAEQRRIDGSGLGLVISRDLAEAMGGRIEASSKHGRGCTFVLQLDAADAPPAMPADAPSAEPPHAPAAPVAAGARVLYIEDAPLNVLLMQEVFRSQPGWQLDVAGDGESGLARAAALAPDLLLVDMNLPDMHGLQLLQRLRAQPATARIPCIALSADALPAQVQAALAAGFDDYWTKPIDVPQLIAALSLRLNRAQTKAGP